MPLRFGIHKAKRYDVSTKNSYIVCVHLLDSVLIECTLNTSSTGKDCLENISSRIGLNEIQYFGLRFTNKKTPTLRWVDLDKPLKKQLEKYAQSPMLYFGVMFCIGDVTQIQDEMSRYQYYLYLKTEIIDGRLQCTPEHAILLAAYGVQAELGDYNSEMHGNDYLNNMVLLPQNLSTEDHIVRQLTCEIASMHQQLRGFPPATAKLHYIQLAQELEGYGLEYYPVKDTAGKELLLGTSFVGIFVKPLSGNQPTVYFKWSDIVNFSNSKRQLGIDTKLSDKPFYFLLENAEFAKYVYRMCCRQQRFYKANSHLQATPSTEEREGESCGVHLGEDNTAYAIPDLQQDVLSSTADEMNPTNTSLNDYLQSVNDSTNTVIINENSIDEHSRASLHQLHLIGTELPPGSGGVQGPGMHGASIQTLGMQGSDVPITEVYQHDLPTGVSRMYGVQPVRSEHGLVQQAGLARLPSYRPPPDYRMIMSQKLDNIAQQTMLQRTTTTHLTQDVLAYSQPDIHQMPLEYVTYYNNGHAYIDRPFYGVVEGGLTYHPARPVDRTSSLIVYPSGVRRDDHLPYHPGEHPVYLGIGGELLGYQPSRPVDRSSSLMVYPSLVGRDGLVYSRVENVPDVAAMLQYRQPPPYGRQSTSTPDLALQMVNAVSHSTPDLATCHSRPHLIMQSRFDQSLENLALDTHQLQFYQLRSNQSNDNIASSSGSRAEVNRVAGKRDVNRSAGHTDVDRATGHVEVKQSTGEVDVNQSVGLFESNRSVHLPFPDVTKNGAADTNASGRSAMGVSVDLSRLAMLQHFEKQNRVILQKMAENPSVARDDYLQQLRLQEAFRNLQINSTKSSESGAKHLPKSVDEAQRIAPSDVRDFQQKSNGLANPLGHSSDCSEDMGVPQERRTGSQRSENDRAPVVGSAGANSMMQKAGGNTGNLEVRRLTENAGMVSQRGGGGSEMEAEPKGPNDESRQTLESKLEDGQVFVEFEQVPKKRQKFDCSTALAEVNRDRNRFKDVLPYEDNRVKLKPTKENPTGYINASHIRVQVGKQEFSYIATQGPLANTVIDFWQMIYENNIRVISMLTGLNDPEQRKCAKYWPVRMGAENALKFGDFSVALRYINECWSYVTRGLIVRHDPSRTERLVWHLQYTEWPDRGCPSNPAGFLEYLDELSAIKRQVMLEQNTQKPACVVVHCSAGVGRTGVLVLTEMMKTIMEHNGNVDVPSALKMLRNQRMHMVQTVSQYSFVYKMINLYFQSSRLI